MVKHCGLQALAAAYTALLQGFTSNQLSNVRGRLMGGPLKSWEMGTAAEALTEYSWPRLSVFNDFAFPPPSTLPTNYSASDVLNIAQSVVSKKPQGSLALIANDGSAGDPASIGVAVLLANWTRTDLSNTMYADAAGEQLDYLLNHAPRTPEGAISHRTDQAQLWSDFVYMVPPFIAYFGSLQGGGGEKNLLQIAYDQCRLYREGLRDNGGLWRHVAQGSWEDSTHWATGNGWAAAGMLRTLETLNRTTQANLFQQHQLDLVDWINEILEASWAHQKPNGTLLNVIDDPTSFADTASTALIASVTYRMAVFTHNDHLVSHANKALGVVKASIGQDGTLKGTTDPETFHEPISPGEYSPEGQAFVLLLQAAWKAYRDAKTS
ncbi:Six-hairpin glycosidase [Pluteus cervinus]|uniref:Six-hairpin glycosidase n=1 Tax=Pluteus cervinus TaxID=181527 RepID=A0ACD3B5C6_9AGAR|nr:Six-hairpin glycosidase [Pluteus cervinus]